MGSKLPVTQICLEQLFIDPANVTWITLLANSIYYFLDHVFIIIAEGDYRLLVIHRNHVLWDKNYKTIKGAKIAFSKRFGPKAAKKFRYSHWSDIYPPDDDWLMDKLNLANNSN